MNLPRQWAAAVSVAALTLFQLPAQAQHFVLEGTVAASRYDAPSGLIGDSAAGFGLLGRYTWPSGFGLEAGTRAHGAFSVSSAAGEKVRVDVTSYQFGASYELPLGPVTLGASLGAHNWRDRGDVYGPNRSWQRKLSGTGTDLYHSLGLRYALSERSSLGLARSEFRFDDGNRLESLDLRFGYRF